MRHLLLTLTLFSLAGCQESDPNEGYDLGYKLTCGLPSSAGNKLVVQSQFAYNFLAGAKACAQEYPERARQILGLPANEAIALTEEPDMQAAPAAAQEGDQQEGPSRAPPAAETSQPAVEAAQAPAKAKAKASAASKAATSSKAPSKSKAPATAKAPAAAKPPPAARTATKSKAPTAPKASAASAPAAPAKAPGRTEKATSPPPAKPTASAPAESREQTTEKRKRTSYERFMGY